MGLEEEGSKLFAEMDVHLMGEGVAGAGGRVEGERALIVEDNMLDERYGGMRKCKWSSLIRT